MTRRIALYQDYVQNNGSLVMALQDVGVDIVHVDAAAIIAGALSRNIAALIIPGGADLYYCEKLNGAGNAAIRAYVEDGGCYLGICAGAYYGCTSLYWNDGAISGLRELNFIDAQAIGPITDLLQDGDIEQSWYAAPTLQWNDQSFKALYAAGPGFKLREGVDVIAMYEKYGPAVIGKAVGAGYVILSSPHIEVSGDRFAAGRYAHLARFPAHEAKIANELTQDTEIQKNFWKFIVEKLINHA